ncbi:unnamed protein product [Linum tenue]|uniref:CBF1-interacting co-repressor CIR N-terminal domain-containing protein n=1 Tax=Linum tenue TaxID=586396 RepID=A0AAV0Q1M5_9ROSI|nr:unnamed protein product [Linum tenue]
MGGHGGLNILPQKRWNVYNFDNREKVRKDEEAAAKEEQLKREQARKRDTEFRIEQLRTARGLAPITKPPEPEEVKDDGRHINLFEGIRIFDPIMKPVEKEGNSGRDGGHKKKKMKKEEVRVVTAEDEKYRLGYGLAGKGVKLPWYLEKRKEKVEEDEDSPSRKKDTERKKSGKKTVEELREERLKREKREKERQRAVLAEQSRRDGGFSRR